MDVADEATLARDLARWCIKVSNTMLKNKDQKRAKVIIRGADGECYDLRIKRLGPLHGASPQSMKEKDGIASLLTIDDLTWLQEEASWTAAQIPSN